MHHNCPIELAADSQQHGQLTIENQEVEERERTNRLTIDHVFSAVGNNNDVSRTTQFAGPRYS